MMFDQEFSALEQLESGSSGDNDTERNRIYAQIRDAARSHPIEVRRFVEGLNPLKVDEREKLWYIYEALSPESRVWETLYISELERQLSACAQHPSDKELFALLQAFMFLDQSVSPQLRSGLRAKLLGFLESPHASVRRACADLLGSFAIAEDQAALEALRRALLDPDWKVRYFAELSLSENRALPHDYAPSILDRIRRRLISWSSYV